MSIVYLLVTGIVLGSRLLDLLIWFICCQQLRPDTIRPANKVVCATSRDVVFSPLKGYVSWFAFGWCGKQRSLLLGVTLWGVEIAHASDVEVYDRLISFRSSPIYFLWTDLAIYLSSRMFLKQLVLDSSYRFNKIEPPVLVEWVWGDFLCRSCGPYCLSLRGAHWSHIQS